MKDEDGVALNDPLKPDSRKGGRAGDVRTLSVLLDPAQYHLDMRDGRDVYHMGGRGSAGGGSSSSSSSGGGGGGGGGGGEGLNLLVRRKGKENNFKSILETIRDLMNTNEVGKAVPAWLHDLFLGYGDPAAAHYKSLAARRLKQEQLAGIVSSTK